MALAALSDMRKSVSLPSLRLTPTRTFVERRGQILLVANLLLAFVSAVLLTNQIGGWSVTYTVRPISMGSWGRVPVDAAGPPASVPPEATRSCALPMPPKCCHIRFTNHILLDTCAGPQNQLRIFPNECKQQEPPPPPPSADMCLNRRAHYASMQRHHSNWQQLRQLRQGEGAMKPGSSREGRPWPGGGGGTAAPSAWLVPAGQRARGSASSAGLPPLPCSPGHDGCHRPAAVAGCRQQERAAAGPAGGLGAPHPAAGHRDKPAAAVQGGVG